MRCMLSLRFRRPLSSKEWLNRQSSDHYNKQSKVMGYRCRSAFKLLEILDKTPALLKTSQLVELGSFPGGWTQVFASKLKCLKKHVAVDLQQMQPVDGVSFIKGDFREEFIRQKIQYVLQSDTVEMVACDAAPSKTNSKEMDAIKASELAAEAWEFARRTLSQHGHFLCKMFQSGRADELEKLIAPHFQRVSRLRPVSVRKSSSEYYLLCISLMMRNGGSHSRSESSV